MQPTNLPRSLRTLLLVRHGESERNADGVEREADSDSPLSDRGRGQASSVARWVAQGMTARSAQQIESREILLRSSPSKRCVETAETIARRVGCRVVIDDDLREPPERAPTAAVTPDEARAMLERVASGGALVQSTPTETHAMLVARLRAALDRAMNDSAGTVVLVSHFVTLNVLLRVLVELESPRPGVWVRLENASVTRVDVDGGGVIVGYVNRLV